MRSIGLKSAIDEESIAEIICAPRGRERRQEVSSSLSTARLIGGSCRIHGSTVFTSSGDCTDCMTFGGDE